MAAQIQTCKYVRGVKPRTPEQVERIRKELKICSDWQNAIAERIAFLADCLTDANEVSFIHHGIVEEVDREILAEDENAFCVRVRNQLGRVEYLTKAQLRK